MTNVLASASKSTSTIFDTFGVTAQAVTQTVTTIAKTIDWADAKVSVWHKAARLEADKRSVTLDHETTVRAASKHAEFLVEHSKKLQDPAFAAAYEQAAALFTPK